MSPKDKTRTIGSAAGAPDPNDSKVGAEPKENEEGVIREKDLPVASAPRHEDRGYSTFDKTAREAAAKAAEAEAAKAEKADTAQAS